MFNRKNPLGVLSESRLEFTSCPPPPRNIVTTIKGLLEQANQWLDAGENELAAEMFRLISERAKAYGEKLKTGAK